MTAQSCFANPILKWTICTALAIFLAACLPTAQNPLPVSADHPLDKALYGAWIGSVEDEEDPVLLHFLETVDGKHKAILVTVQTPDDSDGGWAEFDVTSSTLSNGNFLNLYWTESDGEAVEELQGFHLMRYELGADDTLSLFFIDGDMIAEAIEEGALDGTVSSSGMTKSIRMTASSEKLAAYIESQNPMKLFAEAYGTFKPAF